MNAAGKKVAVTGASGFIASWLVKLLLEHGYTVNASVRDPSDPRKIEQLLLFKGSKEKLRFFGATILQEGSFDTLVEGCHAVFHTASPVIFSTNNPQEDLVDPAVKGTLNLLRSCQKVKSIKRVILTSSVASIIFNQQLKPGVVIDETWFSDSAFCEEKKLWYPLSKILAEEAAWKFCKENGMDLVAIHPGTVWGPMVHPSVNPSLGMLLQLVNGTETYPDRTVKGVDVRDVAYAHILAFEVPSYSGRYLLVGSSTHCSEILNTLGQLFLTIQLPNNVLNKYKFLLTDDPAIKGTLNLLRSCQKVKSIKRVILTSSVASVIFNQELKPGVVIDETWFSDSAFCEEKKLWYPWSKILAEEAAWKFCKENRMDMVAIHPGTVWGPMVHPSVNPSLGMLLQLVNGTETYPDRTVKGVDVRDVAYAHILAFEVPSASWRYLLVGSSTHCSEILNTLGQLFPTIQLPNKSVFSPLALPNHTIVNVKANDLGINFIPLEKTLKDTIESFKEKNLIAF